MRRGVLLIGLASVIAGCGGGARASAPRHTGPSASCRHPTPVGRAPDDLGLELQGTGVGATLYGLLMARHVPPYRVGDRLKIVWRMTGRGPLTLRVVGPGGVRERLAWGPEAHGGSNYHRPGYEWGAGYRFTRAGCWQLTATRRSARASVWLHVDH